MALVNNHQATGSFQAATSGTVTLTNNANAIVVIDVYTERAHAAGAHTSVTSITSTHTSGWQKRSDVILDNAGHNTAYNHVERWWTYVSGALTSEVYTVNVGASVDAAAMVAGDWTGFTGTGYQTNPWDSANSYSNTGTASGSKPTITGVSCNANCALLVSWATNDGNNPALSESTGLGFTNIGLKNNAAGAVNWAIIRTDYSINAGSQSSISVDSNTTTPTTWLGLIDALNIAGGVTAVASAGAADGSSSVAGVGASLAKASGAADGTSSVAGVTSPLVKAAGAADGVASVAGVGASKSAAAGHADGVASVAGVGASGVQPDQFVRIFNGVIGDVAINRRGLATFQARGLLTLGRGIITERYGPQCRNDLGDDAGSIGSGGTCMVPILPADVKRSTAYRLNATATLIDQSYVRARTASAGDPSDYANVYYECTTAGTTAGTAPTYDPIVGHTTTDGSAVFTARNAWLRYAMVSAVVNSFTFTLTAHPDSRDVDDWFALGEGIVRSGPRTGSPFHVKTYVNSSKMVTCFMPIDTMLAANYWIELSPGCDKTPTMCNGRYANILNYHGEDFTPGRDLPLTQA